MHHVLVIGKRTGFTPADDSTGRRRKTENKVQKGKKRQKRKTENKIERSTSQQQRNKGASPGGSVGPWNVPDPFPSPLLSARKGGT